MKEDGWPLPVLCGIALSGACSGTGRLCDALRDSLHMCLGIVGGGESRRAGVVVVVTAAGPLQADSQQCSSNLSVFAECCVPSLHVEPLCVLPTPGHVIHISVAKRHSFHSVSPSARRRSLFVVSTTSRRILRMRSSPFGVGSDIPPTRPTL